MLEKDNNKPYLGYNKRNAIMFRKSEKLVLHHLIECSNLVSKFSLMKGPEARLEIE